MQETLIVLIEMIVLSYLFPYALIKILWNYEMNQILNVAESYKNINNFIEYRKFESETQGKVIILLISVSITLFVAFKVSGVYSTIAYLILIVSFFLGLSFFINIAKFNRHLMDKLYKLKDTKND